MALTQEEQSVILRAKSEGKTKEQAIAALAEFRNSRAQPERSGGILSDFGGDAKDLFLNAGERLNDAGESMVERFENPNQSLSEKVVGSGADFFRGIGRFIGGGAVDAAKLVLPQRTEDAIGTAVSEAGQAVAQTDPAQDLFSRYQSLSPDVKAQVDNVLGYAEGLGELVGAGTFTRGVRHGLRATTDAATTAVPAAGRTISNAASSAMEAAVDTPVVGGAVQTGREFAERVPRFIGNVRETLDDASARAQRIRTSEPVVQEAIKSGVDERIINTVQQADAPTLKAYKEIVDLADTTGTTLKPKQRPEIVAGNAAANQYKLIEQQRRNVGKQIGEAVDKLSKQGPVPINRSILQIDDVLEANGIKVQNTGGTPQLTFTGRFTPAERARIQELYKLAREGGTALTPRQIYDKDQLFSKLQREARFEGIGDIMIETPNGTMSLFRVFRDVFTNALDEVSGDDIRALNRAYRNIVTLQDDIENSIVKTGNFETAKNVDPAEFAQTNLRRILSDAQSAAAYREILEEMDAVSRELGYEGARIDDLVAFAEAMRRLYPDSIPATSFQGGITTGLRDLAGSVLTAGQPGLKDQQRALKALIDELVSNQK